MSPKHIILAIVALVVTLSATDYLIHQVWLKDIHAEDVGKLRRNNEDMNAHMSGSFVGQFLVATAFMMPRVRIALAGTGIRCILFIAHRPAKRSPDPGES